MIKTEIESESVRLEKIFVTCKKCGFQIQGYKGGACHRSLKELKKLLPRNHNCAEYMKLVAQAREAGE